MDNRNMVFTMGLICGAALGAAVGMLYAPKAGDAMRRDLKRQADRFTRRARSLYDNATETVGDFAERGADAIDRVTDAASRISGPDRG